MVGELPKDWVPSCCLTPKIGQGEARRPTNGGLTRTQESWIQGLSESFCWLSTMKGLLSGVLSWKTMWQGQRERAGSALSLGHSRWHPAYIWFIPLFHTLTLDYSQGWWTPLWCLSWATWLTCGMCLSTGVFMPLQTWPFAWVMLSVRKLAFKKTFTLMKYR